MKLPDYSPAIRFMLEDRDLNALVTALRSPANTDLRSEAARALGELGDIDATESLIRAVLEDPEITVQAAARQALTEMHGSRSELVIASYRSGPPEIDEWLVEPDEEEFDLSSRANGALTGADIDGLLLVVSHESNPVIREKAIRALGQFTDTRSTDMLVYLTLHSADDRIRAAAHEVLLSHFGDQANDLIQVAANESDEEEGWSTEDEAILAEDEYDEADDEIDEDLDDELDEEEFEPASAWGRAAPARRPSDFPQVTATPGQAHGSPTVQEIGVPWRVLIIVGIVILILGAVLLLNP